MAAPRLAWLVRQLPLRSIPFSCSLPPTLPVGATLGDGPVVYDLYCGEGGFSRGARLMGARCYGFDKVNGMRHAYENDPAEADKALSPPGGGGVFKVEAGICHNYMVVVIVVVPVIFSCKCVPGAFPHN